MKGFDHAKKWLADIDAPTAARLLTASADVALIVTPGNPAVVRDVSFGSDEVEQGISGRWVGRPWVDLVTVESRSKVLELLKDAETNAAPRWRHINHPSASSDDLPILYTATRLGANGPIVAMGRSLRPVAMLQQRLLDAQQAMDREYGRLRQAEMRHRLLFKVSSEAVLIADAITSKILEANPAASQLLDKAAGSLVGRTLDERLDPSSQKTLAVLLNDVKSSGRPSEARLRTQRGRDELNVAVSLFREDRGPLYLIRLSSQKAGAANARGPSIVLDVVNRSPDAFLVTSLEGRIEFANQAFLDMAELATPPHAVGENITRWLGRPGVDFNLISGHLKDHGSMRLYATTIQGQYGARTDVEICAVAVPDGDHPCLGFSLRNVSQRVAPDRRGALERPRSVEQLAELVGRVPLKELVRESSDMIEKLCIEAALELTGDNRASAAEILGLSRQSLYSKLRRYGLGDLVPFDRDDQAANH